MCQGCDPFGAVKLVNPIARDQDNVGGNVGENAVNKFFEFVKAHKECVIVFQRVL